jgi:hypothetical protein
MKKLVMALVISIAALGGTTLTMQFAGSHHEFVQTHTRRGVPMLAGGVTYLTARPGVATSVRQAADRIAAAAVL